jgi:hypothetical protein
MATLPLDESRQITLDGSGNGAVTIGPTYSYQTWTPSQINVQVTSNLSEPVFKYYRGASIGNTNYLGGTYTGSNDQSVVSGQILQPGEVFLCVWTGGDPGAVASVNLNGTKDIP